ncbi:MAG: protoporphyrinogen oxidase [Blastocatellia bacterium]|nr:protoporphyrinogen oxidase [Blastocatellia bacterium]
MNADVAVIGAGISGLSYAHRARKAGRSVVVLESGNRAGGVIRTHREDGFLVECGPNSVRMTDELEELIADLGLDGELVKGDPRAARYVYRDGRLMKAPMGPASLVTSPVLSVRGKLRVLAEPFVRAPRDASEPTIAEFITRRFGREVHDILVSAFVSGIYAGDTTKLSAAAVFPKLVELERERGGVVRGGIAELRAKRRAARVAAANGESAPARRKRRPLTIVSFADGLDRLPFRIAESLGDALRLDTPVERIERIDGGFALVLPGERMTVRDLVVATPAQSAGTLLRDHSDRLADLLDGIEYPSLVSVSVAYRKEDVRHDCSGFGFLAPRTAGLRILGGIFPSGIFAGRAPEGWHAFTCFIGGATDPDAFGLDDDDLVDLVADDLASTVGASGPPRVLQVVRWPRAIPQYTIGHVERVAEIERECDRLGLSVLGNYLHGVSVGDCVKSAFAAAAKSGGDASEGPVNSSPV